jgi:glycosyltransferase involved in cell wall biosynthesis
VDFELVGEGPERSRLETKARNEGLSNVTFTGYVDRTTLFGIYAQSDILFAQLRDLPVMSRATFPSKVYEYLAAGRPVVYAGSGITAEFLRSTEAAVIANPEDPESIRQSIAKLAGDEVLRQDMGIRAREASGSHIRQDIAGYVASRLRDSFNPVTVRVQPTALLARRMWKR